MIRKRNRLLLILFIVLILFSLSSCTLKQVSNPPIAKVIPKIDTIHDDIRIDNYFWLQEKSNPEVIEYLKAENKYAEEMMKHTENLQEKLYEELVGKIKETDLTLPAKIDNYYYYSRTEEGKQYQIICRKKGNLDTPEEILVDVNELANGHEYYAFNAYSMSPNHQLMAYLADTTAYGLDLYIKDLSTNKLSDSLISNIHRVYWANDNKTLFYTVLDTPKWRPHKVYRHTIGTDPGNDELIYHEKDEDYLIILGKSKSDKYLFVRSHGGTHPRGLRFTSSEVRYIDANKPLDGMKLIHPRQPLMRYYAYHQDTSFYIRTVDSPNEESEVKVWKASVNNPAREYWKEYIPYQENVYIEDISVFKNHLMSIEKSNGIINFTVINSASGDVNKMELPEKVFSVDVINQEYNTNLFRFSYSSFTTPLSICDLNMDTKTIELKKQTEVPGYKSEDYRTEMIYAPAFDGTMIPISMVYKKDMIKDGDNPVLLYGYGFGEITIEPNFDPNILPLLDRGFIYAIAHIRGGGILGGGTFLEKEDSFTDFISCAEYFINEGYTSSDKLIIKGMSAGGLLLGAVVNMRPDLFKAVVANVPWMDVIGNPYPETLGDPNDEKHYHYLSSYSPYDNIKAMDYPDILVTAGWNDVNVPYWDPAKWVAKLSALKSDDNLLLLKTNMTAAGHRGPSGRYDYLRDIAYEYTFIFNALGIKQ